MNVRRSFFLTFKCHAVNSRSVVCLWDKDKSWKRNETNYGNSYSLFHLPLPPFSPSFSSLSLSLIHFSLTHTHTLSLSLPFISLTLFNLSIYQYMFLSTSFSLLHAIYSQWDSKCLWPEALASFSHILYDFVKYLAQFVF